MDNAVYVNDNGDESSKLDGGNGVENVVQIVSDLFIVFLSFQPTVLVLFPSLKFCYRSNS